jgi:hypothetical protein
MRPGGVSPILPIEFVANAHCVRLIFFEIRLRQGRENPGSPPFRAGKSNV